MTAPILVLELDDRWARAAVIRDGKLSVLPTTNVAREFPLVVGRGPRGEIVYGQAAKRQRYAQSDKTRLNLLRAPDDANEDLVQILSTVRDAAQDAIEEEIEQALLAVPNDFGALETARLLRAAGRARIKVLLTVPRAVALASATPWPATSHKRLVLDVRDTSVERAVVASDGGRIILESLDGDLFEGWEVLREAVVSDVLAQWGVELSADAPARDRIADAVDRVLPTLKSATPAELHVPFVIEQNGAPVDLKLSVHPTEKIRQMCAGWEQLQRGDGAPHELAAGSACHGLAEFHNRRLSYEPALSRSIGFADAEGMFVRVLPRLSKAPATAVKTIQAVTPGQLPIQLKIYTGERRKAQENRHLGNFEISGFEGKIIPTSVEFRLIAYDTVLVSALGIEQQFRLT